MKRNLITIGALAFTALLFGLTASGSAATIYDHAGPGPNPDGTSSYWGNPGSTPSGDVHDPRDEGVFDVTHMDVAFSGAALKVTIHSAFFGSSYMNRPEYSLGNLFLATAGWKPTGSADNHYQANSKDHTDTVWNYAIQLQADGDAQLLPVMVGKGVIAGGSLRDTQEWQYQTFSPETPLSTGTWGKTMDSLTITMDLPEEFSEVTSLGIHWTMFCGNDVIEGRVSPIPEPATSLLFGLGLAGLSGLLRRKTKQ
ncbi:PEP-CTERM sorting domain-containing protein [Desulfogranum mediterraneum]|uniref:PEP-CTERM sorting domain-containing protein n=1 Tax=Desulfogranum mediterraneum TaxID=160661 RepID=UPI000401B537|nr:PEP-CTERM sorting domain-containing protein [Desulfogranum mediterraneum]